MSSVIPEGFYNYNGAVVFTFGEAKYDGGATIVKCYAMDDLGIFETGLDCDTLKPFQEDKVKELATKFEQRVIFMQVKVEEEYNKKIRDWRVLGESVGKYK